MQHIVKRKGHTEPFDGKKLYASVYAAAQAVREPAGSAELIAERVLEDVTKWIDKKHEVTANDIRREAAKHLNTYNPDAAYIFLHHRVVG